MLIVYSYFVAQIPRPRNIFSKAYPSTIDFRSGHNVGHHHTVRVSPPAQGRRGILRRIASVQGKHQ